MTASTIRSNDAAGLARLLRPRTLLIHNGRTLKRIRLSVAKQAVAAGIATALCGWSAFAAVALSAPAPAVDASVEARLASVKAEAAARAARLEQRQRALAAMLTGEGDAGALAAFLPPSHEQAGHAAASPLRAAEARQAAFVAAALDYTHQRYKTTAEAIRALGLSPTRVQRIGAAMGGPYEPIAEGATAPEGGDAQFRQLFQSWARLDQLERGVMSVPSQKPVENLVFTSLYGVRSDPFRGHRAMHAGVDIPGPVGTPIYATADGIIRRAGWANGYGNLIEIGHGRGIDTRYGHLSQVLVQANSRVRRGDLIGRMGSTGRSTGSHLHYEVRIDGRAVDPTPFLRSSDFVLAVQDRMAAETAQGGPEDQLSDD